MLKIIILFNLLLSVIIFAFTDESHFSDQFGIVRNFRVFTPLTYNANDTAKHYPVIYHFNGCRGSYQKDGRDSYYDGGIAPPTVSDRPYNSYYAIPYNPDFEIYTDNNDVIVIAVDGNISDFQQIGCEVYYPFLNDENYNGNDLNYSLYIRELFDVVDSMYNTVKTANGKAITGLSFGGHSAIMVSAFNPHLIQSTSYFSHSPSFALVGPSPLTTKVDVQELWRNFRGIPFRTTTIRYDYLRYFSEQTNAMFTGAGFETEFHLADFCMHWAADIPEQFDFHMNYFAKEKVEPECFSLINFYKDFDAWGYEITTDKNEAGWTYLRDVTKNGFGLYTRISLPYSSYLSDYSIDVKTPPIYNASESYTLSTYSYKTGKVTSKSIMADSTGSLSISTLGGIGNEFGIYGSNIEPAILFLTDTINENIYINAGEETNIKFKVVNLSGDDISDVLFSVTTENTDALSITSNSKSWNLLSNSVTTIDSLFTMTGTYTKVNENKAFIKIKYSIAGVQKKRERIIQVHILDTLIKKEEIEVVILDGRSKLLKIFKYGWGDFDSRVELKTITEGSGNGNGIAELGETFSIWIKLANGYDSQDKGTWHPVKILSTELNPGLKINSINHYTFSSGRAISSTLIELDREYSVSNPVILDLQSEILKMQYANDCHRGSVDMFYEKYYQVSFPLNLIKIDSNLLFTFAVKDSIYSYQFEYRSGVGSGIWSMDTGLLPSGIELSKNGLLSGTTNDTGLFVFDLVVVDSQSSDTVSFELIVHNEPPIGIEDGFLDDENGFNMSQNIPNPFNPITRINYSIPIKYHGNVSFAIYNTRGQLVRNFDINSANTNSGNIIFNGKDKQNKVLPSGLYICKMIAGKYNTSIKMLLLK